MSGTIEARAWRWRLAAGLLCAGLLSVDAAFAQTKTYCSEPVTPFCVNREDVYGDPVAKDRCRAEVEDYAAGLRRYVACLGRQAEEAEARALEIEQRFACMEGGGSQCR